MEDQTKISERSSMEMYIEDSVKYSIIVVRRRAFAEIRDGLKPVQRRVLYGMLELNAIPGKPARKSARIVGDTMGKYHPHGDSSIYDAMATIAQFWKCKVPLIEPNSSFGTIMGDKPPHMRYSEARLSKFAMDCIFSDLLEIHNVCNWKDNFDMTEKEPEFLPCKVPLLLINGSFGIGVATSNSNIPPHNLVEVIEATRALIKDPNQEVVLVPDFCTPVDIIDTDWREISNTGYGKFDVKGRIEIAEENGYPVLHVRSLPENTNSNLLQEKLLDMIEKKQLPMIKNISDGSSNQHGIDVIITLKKGSDPKYMEQILYTKAGVATKEYVNFYVIDDINPKRMSYKEYLLSFIDFAATTKFRIYCNKYKNNRTRCHKLETYISVIRSGKLNEVIDIIRKQNTTSRVEAREILIKKLNISDLQADFILAVDIMQLSKGYLTKYEQEYNDLIEEQKHYRQAITDNGVTILSEIDQELVEIEKKYGAPRVCRVVQEESISEIPAGRFKVILTNNNLIRKIPDTEKVTVVKKDNPKFMVSIDNRESLLLFDNKGRVFKLPIHKIPVSDKSYPGTDIRILVKNLTADVISMFSEKIVQECVKMKTRHYLVVCTAGNIIKKLDLEDFLNVNPSGLLYSKLKDGDTVAGVDICPAELNVVIYSKQKALRISIDEIPLFKRNASGSKAMETKFDIEGLSVLYPDVDMIAVVTEMGRVNLIPMITLPQGKRGRAGNSVIKLASNDNIKKIYGVASHDSLKLETTEGTVIVDVKDLKLKSGVAAGDKIPGLVPPVVRCSLDWSKS